VILQNHLFGILKHLSLSEKTENYKGNI